MSRWVWITWVVKNDEILLDPTEDQLNKGNTQRQEAGALHEEKLTKTNLEKQACIMNTRHLTF